ncbi:Protein mother of FT and TF 1 [Apostasia shenzhenica]|uniref:Protein mother of FT and TF 1 n=1 Tax=Apostasia shenzhenica TaxID=1088818 RepID=A0A2I0AHV5_9ASPA|nr:Protein mother of FT and TF 1 [Apostasia shenzhenica]
MATYVDPLVVGRVIGDVVDFFMPTVAMSVNFNSKNISNSCRIKPAMAINQPIIHITGRSSQLFTLVMTDPDAPSPSDPIMREWVHCGPQPTVGIHRYVLVLFLQKSPFQVVAPPTTRANFSTREFAARFDLGLPVAAAYFNSQKEPAARRR